MKETPTLQSSTGSNDYSPISGLIVMTVIKMVKADVLALLFFIL